jgi:uncharacterized protein YdhG (YjbR/CyaY superfamily)
MGTGPAQSTTRPRARSIQLNMNPELLNSRLKDLRVTLQQIRGTIPETSGELREELEWQYQDVQSEIAKIVAQSKLDLVVVTPRSTRSAIQHRRRICR